MKTSRIALAASLTLMAAVAAAQSVPTASSVEFFPKKDRYARGIGLVYQEFIMWEYQPPHENVPVGQTTGFGIRRSMIDHN